MDVICYLFIAVSFAIGFIIGFRTRLHRWLKSTMETLPSNTIGQMIAYERVRDVVQRPGATLSDVVELLEREGDRFESLGKDAAERSIDDKFG